jgi:hypothetical protein
LGLAEIWRIPLHDAPSNMSNRNLLIVSTLIELGAGVALLAVPSLVADLLLGEGLSAPPALVVARVAGGALSSLGIMCWLGRNGERRAQSQLAAGMLFYNLAVTLVLVYARIACALEGIALWPACILHVLLAIWCVACLRPRS